MGGRVGRVVLSLAALALLFGAWRAQVAFQFAGQRTLWGWRAFGAVTASWLLWWAVTRGATPARAAMGRGREAALVVALVALGVAFRVVHFASVPPGMNHDAAFNGMYALHVLQGAPYTPYVSAAWGRETLFMYLCAPLVAWFGNVPEPIQLAATLVGVATLPIFYAFARAVAGPRLALIGLALLAVCGWHGVFSRVGWRMILVPPFEMLALTGLWAGLGGRRWGWLVAGAAAAGAIYTYDAGRMVPLMVAALLALAAVARPARWRHHLLGGLVVLLAFVIVGAPMLSYAATHPQQFLGRASSLAGSSQEGLLGNLRAAILMFAYRGNGNDFFVDEPLLEPLLAVLFGVGLLAALTRWRDGGARFLLGGFALALLPGILAVPNGNRCITALPFALLFCAGGLSALADVGATLLPGAAGRRAAALLVAAVVAVAGVETYQQFLGATPRRIIGFGPEATAAGEYLRGFDDRYARYVVAEDWPEYTLAYLSYNGGGSPLENHYVLGRRLEDIEARINRYGRRGLVFATDLKPAGRAAFERLSRQFAEHRTEEISNRRAGGDVVGRALIVEPQHAATTAPDAETSRLLAAGGSAAAPAPVEAGSAFDGGQGDAPGAFDQPIGIAVGPHGQIFVGDRNNHRVQAFARDGRFVRAWGRQGAKVGEFREPHDVAADDEFVYVADLWNQRVQVFDGDGQPAFVISGAPSFSSPRGLAVRDQRVYVAEAGAGRVTAYDRSGALVATYGTGGGGEAGHLIEPVDVAVAPNGDVWVVNSGNNRLERFAADGRALGSIPVPGWSGARLKEVYLAVGDDGTLYVGDWDAQAVRRFRPDGQEVPPLGDHIKEPSGIALDRDRLLVVSRGEHMVRVVPLAAPGP